MYVVLFEKISNIICKEQSEVWIKRSTPSWEENRKIKSCPQEGIEKKHSQILAAEPFNSLFGTSEMIGMCRWVFPGSPRLVGSYAILWPPTQWILLQHCCQCMCSSRTLAVSWLRTSSDNRAESVGSKHMFVSNSSNIIGYWFLSLSHVSFSFFFFGNVDHMVFENSTSFASQSSPVGEPSPFSESFSIN